MDEETKARIRAAQQTWQAVWQQREAVLDEISGHSGVLTDEQAKRWQEASNAEAEALRQYDDVIESAGLPRPRRA